MSPVMTEHHGEFVPVTVTWGKGMTRNKFMEWEKKYEGKYLEDISHDQVAESLKHAKMSPQDEDICKGSTFVVEKQYQYSTIFSPCPKKRIKDEVDVWFHNSCLDL